MMHNKPPQTLVVYTVHLSLIVSLGQEFKGTLVEVLVKCGYGYSDLKA